METKQEAAETRGLIRFDCTLPQSWVNATAERGWDVRPHFVWSYDGRRFGAPYPITDEGIEMAGEMAAYIN